MIHPHAMLGPVDPVVGLGVLAERPICRGAVTWILDPMDLRLSAEQVRWLGPDLVWKYTYPGPDGRPILCWDHARHVNHSCAPTTLSLGGLLDLAVRDIERGEELTTDYSALNLERAFECACGEPECRGTIRPEDAADLAPRWDTALAAALGDLDRAPQTLLDRLDERVRRALERAGADPEAFRAILGQLEPQVSRNGGR